MSVESENIQKSIAELVGSLTKREVNSEELANAFINLQGFGRTLIKMKMEIDKNGLSS